MKKKIIFSCLAFLFFDSSVYCFRSGDVGSGVFCLVIAGVFCFVLYRSFVPRQNSADPSIDATNPYKVSTPASESENVPSVEPPVPQYDFVEIKVAGVTFKNEKGPSRQTILRKLKFRDKPFEHYAEVELRSYEYEGSPAYAVYANDMQIGNIPADMVQFINDNRHRIDSISHIDVYGGGRSSDGHQLSYGCKIILKLKKDALQST